MEQVILSGKYSQKSIPRNWHVVSPQVSESLSSVAEKARNSNARKRKVEKIMEQDICRKCYAESSQYATACVLDIESNAPVLISQYKILAVAETMRVLMGRTRCSKDTELR